MPITAYYLRQLICVGRLGDDHLNGDLSNDQSASSSGFRTSLKDSFACH